MTLKQHMPGVHCNEKMPPMASNYVFLLHLALNFMLCILKKMHQLLGTPSPGPCRASTLDTTVQYMNKTWHWSNTMLVCSVHLIKKNAINDIELGLFPRADLGGQGGHAPPPQDAKHCATWHWNNTMLVCSVHWIEKNAINDNKLGLSFSHGLKFQTCII